jgi:hypothetical protein
LRVQGLSSETYARFVAQLRRAEDEEELGTAPHPLKPVA